jgi:hypothetical protein
MAQVHTRAGPIISTESGAGRGFFNNKNRIRGFKNKKNAGRQVLDAYTSDKKRSRDDI